MITVDTVFVYLCQLTDWISDVEIAIELGTSIPVTRKLLKDLDDAVEDDGNGNWRVVKTNVTEIVPVTDNELTDYEEKELLRLERRVEKGFYLAGEGLKRIRDSKLYRQQYSTFEEYCRERFNFSRVNAFYLIKSVEVVNNLSSNLLTNGYQNLPSSVRQVRPLTKLSPEQQLRAWQKALSYSPNGKPSGKLVSQVVTEIKERREDSTQDKVRQKLKVNDVVRITGRHNSDIKTYLGYWGVINQVYEHSYQVIVWNGTLDNIAQDDLMLIKQADVNCVKELLVLFEQVRLKFYSDGDVLSILQLLAKKPVPQISETVLAWLRTSKS